jgi:uncharacterized delta-60 repeat protein
MTFKCGPSSPCLRRNSDIARLNADGSLDTAFNPGSGFNNRVEAIAMPPDGKILVGGEFTTCAGSPAPMIARLNADGTCDASFTPGSGATGGIYGALVQADGRVVLTGAFTKFDGVTATRVVRLQ